MALITHGSPAIKVPPRPTDTERVDERGSQPPPGYDQFSGWSLQAAAPPDHRDRLARRLYAAAAALGVVLLALVLMAQGGSNPGNSFDVVAAAAEHTARYDGLHYAYQGALRYRDPGGGELRELRMHGQVIYNGTLHLQRSVSFIDGLGPSFNPIVSIDDFGRGNEYERSPIVARDLPAGNSWLGHFGKPEKQVRGLPSPNDPNTMLELLRASSKDITNLGAEAIDGTETTHYRGAIDPARYARLLRAWGKPGEASRVARETRRNGGPPVMDVWIDPDQLVRRIGMSAPAEEGGGPGARYDITADLSHFGDTPPISVPAAKHVFDPLVAGRQDVQTVLRGSSVFGSPLLNFSTRPAVALDPQSFRGRANSICAQFNSTSNPSVQAFQRLMRVAGRAIVAGNQGSSAAQERFKQLQPRLLRTLNFLYLKADAQVQTLARLQPPPSLRADVNHAIGLANAQLALYRPMGRAIATGAFNTRVSWAMAESVPLRKRYRQLARGLGLRDCANQKSPLKDDGSS